MLTHTTVRLNKLMIYQGTNRLNAENHLTAVQKLSQNNFVISFTCTKFHIKMSSLGKIWKYSGALHSDVNPFQEKRRYPESSLSETKNPIGPV